jgi:uncharacterized membrane protein YeaQ/YmgE (transglycosylase-associated protein family)
VTSRLLVAGVFGAFVGGWIGRAIFKWLLDLDGSLQLILILATAALGVVICVAGELERERR